MSNKNLLGLLAISISMFYSLDTNAQALYVTPSGDVGVGTDVPISSLEVIRDDGTAQILVTETNSEVTGRTLFRISNPGNTKFGVNNSDAGVEWSFANPGTGFRLSRQGSGVVEMEISNNGDVEIAGILTEESDVNAKTAITDIDPEEILELVTALPVTKWEYKDARGVTHIGPMAQDFYSSFGLGKSDTRIATLDTAGVALVAIKALADKNARLENEIKLIHQQNRELIDSHAQLRTGVQQQQVEFVKLKAMMIDLQMRSQQPGLLTSTK
jgi:hypothetical protein